MATGHKKDTYKKFVQFVVGFFILILGITLILVWWHETVALFKGALGVFLALGGLLTLYALNQNK